jgi:hypothetical protein
MDNKFRLPESTRRIFMKKALLALGASAAPLGISQAIADDTSLDNGLKEYRPSALSTEDCLILDAVADTFIPRGGAFEVGAIDVDLTRRIDRFLALDKPDVVTGVRGALRHIEVNAPSSVNEERKFSELSFNRRTEVLQAMIDGDDPLAAQVFAGLKELCMFYFYSDSASWPNIGYDGPWLR